MQNAKSGLKGGCESSFTVIHTARLQCLVRYHGAAEFQSSEAVAVF